MRPAIIFSILNQFFRQNRVFKTTVMLIFNLQFLPVINWVALFFALNQKHSKLFCLVSLKIHRYHSFIWRICFSYYNLEKKRKHYLLVRVTFLSFIPTDERVWEKVVFTFSFKTQLILIYVFNHTWGFINDVTIT